MLTGFICSLFVGFESCIGVTTGFSETFVSGVVLRFETAGNTGWSFMSSVKPENLTAAERAFLIAK